MARVRFVCNCPDDRPIEERNDCVVRAAALVTGRPYADVNSIFVKHGRKPLKGCYIDTSVPAFAELGMRLVTIPFKTTSTVRDETVFETRGGSMGRRRGSIVFTRRFKYTVASFLKSHPFGRFVLFLDGHAVALIDGVIHDLDSKFRGRRYVEGYFTFI